VVYLIMHCQLHLVGNWGEVQIFGNGSNKLLIALMKNKSRLNIGYACCHSIQNLCLPIHLLSKNLYTELQFYLLFCMGVKCGLSQKGIIWTEGV